MPSPKALPATSDQGNQRCEVDTETTAFLDLYHRTTDAAAAEIRRSGLMVSRENTQDAFFSTHPDSESIIGYGPGVVHVRIPVDWVERGWAVLEDEFEIDGTADRWEEHYVIKIAAEA